MFLKFLILTNNVMFQVPGVDQHYICVTPDQGIVFPSVTYMRNLISKAAVKQGSSTMAVVINCMHVSHTDFTAAESFHAMIEDFKSRGQPVYWFATNANVISTLRAVTGQDLKVHYSRHYTRTLHYTENINDETQ